jgi:hypothetical protein
MHDDNFYCIENTFEETSKDGYIALEKAISIWDEEEDDKIVLHEEELEEYLGLLEPERSIEEYYMFKDNKDDDIEYTRTFYVPINVLEGDGDGELEEDDELYEWKKRYENEKGE